MIYLAAKWLPRSNNQFDYFRENRPFLSTCQKRSTKVFCLSQITLDWQSFAQVRKARNLKAKIIFQLLNSALFPKRARF